MSEKRAIAWAAAALLALAACGKKEDGAGDKPDPKATGVPAEPQKTAAQEPAKPKPPAAEMHGTIKGQDVSYQADGVTMKGYLAYDTAREGQRPGVLVVHEWWGHNDYARDRARQLAALGYTALAVDMYGDGKQADHPKQAGEFSSAVMKNIKGAKARFDAARALLEAHETTDPDKTAAIGYCFGGGVVLHMARMGADLDGVVSFHGSLKTETPAKPGEVKAKVAVFHGAADPFVPAADVDAFKKEMEAAGVDLRFTAYEGVSHSFTTKKADEYAKQFDLPIGYNADADAKSWEAMKAFLTEIFAD